MKGLRNVEKKIILVLTSTFPRWKGDTTPPFVFELEKRLTDKFKIYILAPHFEGAQTYENMDGLIVRRFRYFYPTRFQKLCYEGGILSKINNDKKLIFLIFPLLFFEFISAYLIIKKQKVKLIHAHWIIPQGLIAYLLKIATKIPYIITAHGSDVYGLQGKFLGTIKRNILNNASKITVVSTAMKKELLTKVSSSLNIEVASMGVSAEMFSPNKVDKGIRQRYSIKGPFLLFIGRLSETKGVIYLIKAMKIITNKFPKSKLLIIGDGPQRNELEILTNKLNLNSNIEFLGAIPYKDLPPYYATADIFISPAIQTQDGASEGFGLTLVEAAFSGCIPIGTEVGGVKDIIKDKETGLLVAQKDETAISTRVINILKDRKLREKIKLNTRDLLIQLFDWKLVKQKYYLLYSNN
jgi:glycosyltransferase involved in cell wall biosynthesis